MRLPSKASLRYLLRHPWQLGLTILGIALGVAVVVAVDLANSSARLAFKLSMEQLSGRATHQIVGGPTGLAEELFVSLRMAARARPSAPVVEGYGQSRGETLHLLGIAPLAESGFREHLQQAEALPLERLLSEPDTALLADVTARRMGLEAGDTFTLEIAGEDHRLTLLGLLDTDNGSAAGLDGLLITDIATAQVLTDMVGRLSWIDLQLPQGQAGTAARRRIESRLPEDARLVRAGSRQRSLMQMSQAFHTNLTAMSLLALVVGMFLIYNTMGFAVLRRRPLIGTLRVLGVTQREIFAMIVMEAILLGVLGTALGLALGVALGQGLLDLVTRTINDLYFAVTVGDVMLTPTPVLKGSALGLGATLVAVLAPAFEAARTQPRHTLTRSLLEERVHALVPWLAGAGLLLGAAAGGLLLAGDDLVLGFASLFLLLVAVTLLVPLAVVALARACAPLLGSLMGLQGRMAAREVHASLSRTGVAIAALMLAVSTTVGVGVMIESFRDTVRVWLGARLQADLYLSVPGLGTTRAESRLDPKLVQKAADMAGVADVMTLRSVTQETDAGLVRIQAVRASGHAEESYRLKQGDAHQVWPAFRDAKGVLVSEPLAYRRDLGPGARIDLHTRDGPASFPILGIYYEYDSGPGVVLMHRRLYDRHWDDPAVDALGLFLAPGASAQVIEERLRPIAAASGAQLRATREIRERSMAIFDRTFAITEVLRLLTVLVAFVGILSALMALQLERVRSLGILRATGFTPGQVGGLVTLQTGLMGLMSGLLAIPSGLLLAEVLIHVINRRAFGWSMQTLMPADVLAEAMVLAIASALLAGLYPAWRMARIDLTTALRTE